ncbi:MAG: DUF1552 domain-containing protein, partial [Planctomycetota bacterium]
MISPRRLSRRTMLRGAGAAVSLPLLDAMLPSARAGGIDAAPPTRLAYLYIPNGVADGAWLPEEVAPDGRLLRLNRWMRPLEPFRDRLVIFRDLWTPRGNGHVAGTATWLTGGEFDGEAIHVGGASADQIAARRLRGRTLLPSLELSSRGEGIFEKSLPRNAVSWADARTPLPRDTEPRVIFDRMFRTGDSGLSDRSVLDLVLADARGLKRRVGRDDRRKVDEYLESVRSVERRLKFAEARRDGNSPALRAALVRPDPGIPEDHGLYLRTMLEMVVLAFWADATRVCTFM